MSTTEGGLSKTICPLPWMQMSVAFHTGVRVCCNTDHGGFITREDGSQVRLGDISSVSDYLNLPSMKEIRREMMAGRRPNYCGKCYKIEDAGGQSVRPDYLKRYQTELESQLTKTREDGEIEEPKIHLIDFALSNHCNLKCRMCNPLLSNSLRHDFEELGLPFNEVEVNLARDGWKMTEKFEALTCSVLKETTEMLTTGGEPFLSEQHRFILRKAIELGRARDILLTYHTNLTTLPEELVSLWSHFKRINVHVSLEGFGPLNEYIRYPSQWKRIDQNFEKLLALAETLPIHIQVHTCVQAYGFLGLTDLFGYFDKFKGKVSAIPMPILLDYPPFLGIEALPMPLRAEGISRLRRYFENKRSELTAEGPFRWAQSRAIGNYESFIRLLEERPFDPALFESFVKYTKSFDQLREQDLCAVVPEFGPYYRTFDSGISVSL